MLGMCACTGRCLYLEAFGHPNAFRNACHCHMFTEKGSRRRLAGPPAGAHWGQFHMDQLPSSYFKHGRYSQEWHGHEMSKHAPPSVSPSVVGMGSKHGSIHCTAGIDAGTPLLSLGSGVRTMS